jgi:hypothetical protein
MYAGSVMAVAHFSATEVAEELLSPFSARAVEAICLLMIDALGFEALMKVVQDAISSADTTVLFAMRALINGAVWLSVPMRAIP